MRVNAKHEAHRLFPICDGQGYFDAGVVGDGRQALMAAFYTGTFGLFFDARGRLLEYATTGPSQVGRNPDPNGYGPDPTFLRAWQAQLGFVPGPIRVRQFYQPEQGVGIGDMPAHFADFLEDPNSELDVEERARMFAHIRRWMEEGSFVLYWGNDLWLDGTGQVTSS